MLTTLGQGDLEELLALYEHFDRVDPLDLATAQRRWDMILSTPGLRVFGVREGDRLVGSCVLQITPNLRVGGRPYALLENVVVHRDHRRQGIGTAMVQAALEEAWEADCYKVMLLTGVRNRHTQRFYADAGFDGDEKRGYIARPPV